MCVECGAEFPFTVSEQEFFRTRGFDHDPKRCAPCRRKRRSRGRPVGQGPGAAKPNHEVQVRRVGAGTAGGPSDAPGGRARKEPRPRYAAVCSLCGTATTVPFVPDGVRPIYCLGCLKQTTR